MDIHEGDTVTFEQCWEDEAGNYHDEQAKFVGFNPDNTLKLEWLNVSKEVEEHLNSCTFTAGDIS